MFHPVWLVQELKPHVFWRLAFWLWRAKKIREMQKAVCPDGEHSRLMAAFRARCYDA